MLAIISVRQRIEADIKFKILSNKVFLLKKLYFINGQFPYKNPGVKFSKHTQLDIETNKSKALVFRKTE